MQARAGYAVEAGILGPDYARKLAVGELRAIGQAEAVAVHREACRQRLVQQAELVQCPHRVAGLDDPDPVHVPLGVLLDDLDLDAASAQRDRAGEPADAAADDQDLEAAGGTALSPPSRATVLLALSKR